MLAINPGNDSFWAPQVMYDAKDDIYHMFITYINGIFNNWGGKRLMFHYVSKDLITWKATKSIGTEGCIDAMVYPLHDGTWKMWYKDEKNGHYIASAISDNLTNWKFNNTILNNEGIRNDDNEQGRHADVKVVDDRAFIFYFTHPGRIYRNGKEVEEANLVRYQRSSLQVAELEYQDEKIVCNRNKYLIPD